MIQDVECPYCGEWQEINHDDGYGYEEDKVFQQECSNCGKTFTYTTSISFYYEAGKAPCLNGEEHDLHPICGFPKELFVGKKRCSYCDEEITIDEEAHKKAIAKYKALLKKWVEE